MGRISMPQGRGSLKHNIRDYTQEEKSVLTNIDFNKTNQNIIFVHRNIKDAYEEIFGDAVREYNAKQKRNDQKIKDGWNHLSVKPSLSYGCFFTAPFINYYNIIFTFPLCGFFSANALASWLICSGLLASKCSLCHFV